MTLLAVIPVADWDVSSKRTLVCQCQWDYIFGIIHQGTMFSITYALQIENKSLYQVGAEIHHRISPITGGRNPKRRESRHAVSQSWWRIPSTLIPACGVPRMRNGIMTTIIRRIRCDSKVACPRSIFIRPWAERETMQHLRCSPKMRIFEEDRWWNSLCHQGCLCARSVIGSYS